MKNKHRISIPFAQKLSKRQFLSTVGAEAVGVGLAPQSVLAQEAVIYCGNRAPETQIQAQFSLSYGTAFALRTGDLGPEAYQVEKLNDRVQRRLESLVNLRADPQMKHRGARLRVTSDSETRQYEVSSIRGDPDQPMDKQAVIAKAVKYGRPLLGDDKTGALIDHILHDPLDTALVFS